MSDAILATRKMFQEWPIVLFGPAANSFTLEAKGEKMVIHMGGIAYPASLLAASAKRWIGKPVLRNHKMPQEGRSDYRLRQGGIHFGPVGAVVDAWWTPETNEIRGIIKATSRPWQRTLLAALENDNLHQIGLSQMVRVLFDGELKVGRERLPVVSEISEIHSLDLTSQPLSGGRFLDGGRNQDWLLEAALYRISLI